MEKDFEALALSVAESIKKLADDPDAMGNFVSYLIRHFDTWLQKFCSTPEGLAAELELFAHMYDK